MGRTIASRTITYSPTDLTDEWYFSWSVPNGSSVIAYPEWIYGPSPNLGGEPIRLTRRTRFLSS